MAWFPSPPSFLFHVWALTAPLLAEPLAAPPGLGGRGIRIRLWESDGDKMCPRHFYFHCLSWVFMCVLSFPSSSLRHSFPCIKIWAQKLNVLNSFPVKCKGTPSVFLNTASASRDCLCPEGRGLLWTPPRRGFHPADHSREGGPGPSTSPAAAMTGPRKAFCG